MKAEYICILILVVIALYLILKLWAVKRDLKNLKEELKSTCTPGCDSQMRVTLWDKDAVRLAKQINENLDLQKNLKLDTEKSKRQLEQSVSDIAHDLRTPLTVIKGNLKMLEKENLTERGQVYLQISNTKAETLKQMVDTFFEMSVLESDTEKATLQKVDLIDFLSRFLLENETLIRNKGLTPDIQFPDKSVYIQAEPAMLTRVLGNIMSNILKYAEESFTLAIEEKEAAADRESIHEKKSGDGSKEEPMIYIRISNSIKDGEEIDPDRIFERTYRADKARTDGSAGLGLYIAKLLVEKQDGTITASVEDNKLQFSLTFHKA